MTSTQFEVFVLAGRLTLNILLSFAQFERELSGEAAEPAASDKPAN